MDSPRCCDTAVTGVSVVHQAGQDLLAMECPISQCHLDEAAPLSYYLLMVYMASIVYNCDGIFPVFFLFLGNESILIKIPLCQL